MTSDSSDRVTIEKDIVYGTTGNRDLRLDLYVPPQQRPEAPSVLLVHGGGWSSGDREQLRGYGILLGRKGYVCACCEYRLSGEAKWPAPLHDVKAALRWMRANSKRLGIDPLKITVSGNSAGAHLALMVGATPNAPEFEGEGGSPGVGTEVAAVIGFYTPTGLGYGGPQAAQGPITQLMGPGASEAAYRGASPLNYARRDFPPTLLIHGNADTTVPIQASLRMHDALLEAGAPVELHTFNGSPHGFDAEPALGRLCADIMALFIDRHVVNPRTSLTTGALQES